MNDDSIEVGFGCFIIAWGAFVSLPLKLFILYRILQAVELASDVWIVFVLYCLSVTFNTVAAGIFHYFIKSD